MFRVFLVLVTASVAMYFAGWPVDVFDSSQPSGQLVSGNRQPRNGGSFLQRPAIRVLSAPSELELKEPGTVSVQAEAPATPGDRIILVTAGSLSLGYNKVSEAVLDENLRATLRVIGREFEGSFKYWARIPASATYQEGQSATFAIAIEPPEAPQGTSCGGATPQKADGSAWQCTFDDEFDGADLDRRFWVPQVTEKSKFTTGYGSMYACGVDSPDTIDVENGNLELSLVELPAVRNCGRNKSSKFAFGQVMHFQTFSQTYGKYEVRAKIPDVRVPGVQQSFWLWPKRNRYGSWPASGEIDFAELYSSKPNVDRPYLHYVPGETAANTNKNVTHADCAINPGEFNTYGVEWKKRQITVLLNDQVCFVNDYSSAAAAIQGRNSPFDMPFFLSLNQAMGDIGNVYDPDVVPDRVTTQIDYVRIWK